VVEVNAKIGKINDVAILDDVAFISDVTFLGDAAFISDVIFPILKMTSYSVTFLSLVSYPMMTSYSVSNFTPLNDTQNAITSLMKA
jgi:hypothetical protein